MIKDKLSSKTHVSVNVNEKDISELEGEVKDQPQEATDILPQTGTILKPVTSCVRLSTIDNFQGKLMQIMWIGLT